MGGGLRLLSNSSLPLGTFKCSVPTRHGRGPIPAGTRTHSHSRITFNSVHFTPSLPPSAPHLVKSDVSRLLVVWLPLWVRRRAAGSEHDDDNEEEEEKWDDSSVPCLSFRLCLWALLLHHLPLISCRSSHDFKVLSVLHRPATSERASEWSSPPCKHPVLVQTSRIDFWKRSRLIGHRSAAVVVV